MSILAAIVIVWADSNGYTAKIKSALNQVASPLYSVVEIPFHFVYEIKNYVTDQNDLVAENKNLKKQVLLLRGAIQNLKAIEHENKQLHKILNSSADIKPKLILGRLLNLKTDPFSHQGIVNKGSQDGLVEGQAVLDEKGLMGLVKHTSLYQSRVLLTTDPAMAIPVESTRSGTRAIAYGTGNKELLEIRHIPFTADFLVGDTLVTSGLGGVFSPGLNVGVITRITTDTDKKYKFLTVKPRAKINQSRYVIFYLDKQKLSANQEAS